GAGGAGGDGSGLSGSSPPPWCRRGAPRRSQLGRLALREAVLLGDRVPQPGGLALLDGRGAAGPVAGPGLPGRAGLALLAAPLAGRLVGPGRVVVVGRLGRPPGLGERGGQRLVVGQLVDGQLGEVGDQLVALPSRVPQVLGRLGQVLAGLHVVDRVDHGGRALAAVRAQLVQLDRRLPCRVDSRRGGRRGARGRGGGDRLGVASLVLAVAPAPERRPRADTECGHAVGDSGQQRYTVAGTAAPAAGGGGTPTAGTAARAGRGGSRSAGRGVLDAGHLLGGPGRSGVAAEEVVELGGRLPVGVTGRLPVGGGALVGHRGDVLGGLGVRVARGRERAVTGRAVRVVPRVGGGLVAGGHLGRQRARARRGYGRYVLRRALVGAGRHRRQELGGPLRPVRRPARPAGDGRQVLGGPLGRHGRQGRAGAVGVAGPVGVVGGSAVGALRAVAC